MRRPEWSRWAGRSFHALKYFYALSLLEAGVSIRALAEYLGHADPAFTLRVYTHLMHQRAMSGRGPP